jgi:RNA polymerase sigma-70 factor (ECF subfamily)
MTAPEAELVSLAVRGDRDAAAELFARIRPGVVRYCRAHLGRVGGAYTTADDVAQEVCLAVLRALPRFRDEDRPFTALVYRIAAHKVTDAQRAAVRQLAVAPADSLFEWPDATPGPEDQAVTTDLALRLYQQQVKFYPLTSPAAVVPPSAAPAIQREALSSRGQRGR